MRGLSGPDTVASRRSKGRVSLLLQRQVHVGLTQETCLFMAGPNKLLALGTGQFDVHPASGAKDLVKEILVAILRKDQFALIQ